MRGIWNSAFVAAALLTSGCATVRTSTPDPNELASGVTYYLPKRDVKLSAERKLLDLGDVRKALATKKAELETVETAIKTATAAEAVAKERSTNAAVLANPEALAAVRRDLAIATADLETAKLKKAVVESAIASLEASLLAANAATGTACPFLYSAKIELLPPVADTRLRLVADNFHNVLRDDEMKLAITPDGLLDSANVVATDRTGDIIVEIASAISGFGGSPATLTEALAGDPPTGLECAQLPTKFAYRFDPVSPTEIDLANQELRRANFPFQIDIPDAGGRAAGSFVVSDTAATGVYDRQRIGANARDPRYYRLADALDHQGRGGALFYRSAIPYMVALRQCAKALTCTGSADSIPIDAALVLLPQAGPISYVPMRSSAFVKTTDDVVFENGMLISWSANRPSEVLEIVRLPVKLLKAVVSVPAEIIKLRIDLSDQEKGLAASQQTQIEAQAKLTAIRDCVRVAGADQAAALACFSETE